MKARLFTDGGARGNPGPAASAYVIEADDGTVLAAHGEAIGVATNNVAEYRALLAGLERAARPRARRARGRLRLGAPRQADARGVQGQERGAPGAVAPGGAPGPRDRRRALHGRPARAQRAGRPPRQRGARRSRVTRAATKPAWGWTAGHSAPSCFSLQEGSGEMFALLRPAA